MSSEGASATGSVTSWVTSEAASITSAPRPSPSPSGSASTLSSSSRGQQVHTVKAGAGGFKFDPPSLEDVAKGDIVTFEFYPPDHSVARAEYMSPCVPYEYTGKDKVGFWSDVQWVDSIDEITHWNLTINSTEPIFYYCAALGSCIDHQMVGVINPNSSQSLDAQYQAAKDSTFMVKPGDPIPKEGSATLSTTGASSTGTSPPTRHSESHGVHLSGGAIAGIVVGAVAFLALCAALFFYVGRTKSLKEMMHRKDATVVRPGQEEAGPGWNGSQHPGSPGFPPQAFSPAHSHAEFYTGGGGATLPPYGQHNATDSHPSGWMSPTQAQQQMAEVKYGEDRPVHEMASPQQNAFTAELEAPENKPR